VTRRTLHTYDYADVAYDDVTLLLAEDTAGVLQAATETAMQRAEEVVARLRVQVRDFEIGRDVEIEVGEFDPEAITQVRVPLRWRAREDDALFPAMEAALLVRTVPVQWDCTQLVLEGSYDPPLGPVGAALDAVVGHHVAEAAVHRFVRDVARSVERAAAES
jgi:hypothetical protein